MASSYQSCIDDILGKYQPVQAGSTCNLASTHQHQVTKLFTSITLSSLVLQKDWQLNCGTNIVN